LLPELLVEPEGLETGSQTSRIAAASGGEDDALLALFRQPTLPADSFLAELRKQRVSAASA
jgi:hypothetical protein